MKYNELAEKLKAVKAEYLKTHGKELETIRELEEFLDRRILKPRTQGLKSLRGLGL